MNTGCDYNYWMYQNQRHEPVKIDSRPITTDTFKQVRGMGGPGNLYNYGPPQNNIPRFRQKFANDQPRMTNYQGVWPSSVYSLPCRPQTQNFHSAEVFPVQSNVYNTSQPLQNHNLQLAQNSNINFSQVQNFNYKGNAGNVNSPNSQNVRTPRLRVKDVSSLNNNYISNNSHLESHLLQPQQKKQNYYLFNPASDGNNKMCNNETQKELVNYDRNTLPGLNQSYHHFEPQATHINPLNKKQQYLHLSGSFCEQSAGYANESQYQFNGSQQIQQQTPEAFNRNNYSHLPVPMTNNKALTSDAQKGSERVNSQVKRNLVEPNASISSEIKSYNSVVPNKSTAFTFSDLLDSAKMSTVSEFQSQKLLALPATSEGPCFSPVTPPNEAATASSENIPVSGQNISTVKITIPHTGESTVINLVNSHFVESNKSSALSLLKNTVDAVCSTRKNSVPQINTQGNATKVSTTCQNSLASPRAGHTCKTPSYSTQNLESSHEQFELVVGCEMNEQNIAEGVLPESSKHLNNKETTDGQRGVKNCLVTPKVENVDSFKEDFENEKPVIKIEDDSVAEEPKTYHPSNQSSSAEIVEEIDFPSPEREDLSHRFKRIKPQAGCGIKNQKSRKEKSNYHSKINRMKLKKLINFLENGDSLIKKGKEKKENLIPVINLEKESSPRPNRRKLHKTCIVKNKNNQREMISLVTSKTLKHFSKISSNINGNNSNDSAEVSGCAESEAENSNSSDNKAISDELSENSEDSKKSLGEEKLLKKALENGLFHQNITEEDLSSIRHIISIMRAFQNLKAHFCVNCNFSSPVGSVWINVISGELRCLNCFRKMLSRREETLTISRHDVDDVNASKAESSHKAGAGEKSNINQEINFENKLNSGICRASKEVALKVQCKDEEELEVRAKEKVHETLNAQNVRGKDAIEISSVLKRLAFEAENCLKKRDSSEEQKKTAEESAESPTQNNSLSLNLSKQEIYRNDLKREKHSTENKTTEKDLKRRRASEELLRPELKNRDEKSLKSENAKEEYKKENRKRSNSTPLPCTLQKVRIVEEPAKESQNKEEEEQAKQYKKKDFHCQKEYDEESKGKKLLDLLEKRKKINSIIKAAQEQAKPKDRDWIDLPRKKITSKDNFTRRKSEEYNSSKHPNKESKREKEKTIHFERKEKPPKISHSKETCQEKKENKIHHEKLAEIRDCIPKLLKEKEKESLKEKENRKANTKDKHADRETYKSHENRKECREKKSSKEDFKKKIRKEKIIGEKTKIEDKRLEKLQREKKSARENTPPKRSDRVVEFSFGNALSQADTVPKPKNIVHRSEPSLFARLMEKTERVSRTLLDGAQ